MEKKILIKLIISFISILLVLSESHTQKIELLPIFTIGKDTLNENEIFGYIEDLAIDSENIYILDSKMWRVQIYGKDGKYKSSIGKKGVGPGEFGYYLSCISLDKKGNIIVGEFRRIHIFDKFGNFIRSFTVDFQFNDLCVDSEDRILILGYKKNKILHAYNIDGKYLFSFGEPLEPPSKFAYKEHPLVKIPAKVSYTKSGRVCFINPYKFEIYIYKNYLLEKKTALSNSYKPCKMLLFDRGYAKGFSLSCTYYSIFESKSLFFISLASEGKNELMVLKNDKILKTLKLKDFPIEMDSEGYLYSINNSDIPYITKYSLKVSSD